MRVLTTARWTVQPPKWLSSTDHKIIGQLFLIGGLLGLLATVVVNVIIGIERVDGSDVTFDNSISQMFDAQRVGLVFGAALPLALALCVALVPLQLGARAIAFPRLASIGFWLWFGGLVLNIVALASDGGTLGESADMVDLFIASLGLMAVGVVAAAMSIGTTVLTTRAPGMTMRRVPFFSWSALITSIALGTRDARVHRHARSTSSSTTATAAPVSAATPASPPGPDGCSRNRPPTSSPSRRSASSPSCSRRTSASAPRPAA